MTQNDKAFAALVRIQLLLEAVGGSANPPSCSANQWIMTDETSLDRCGPPRSERPTRPWVAYCGAFTHEGDSPLEACEGLEKKVKDDLLAFAAERLRLAKMHVDKLERILFEHSDK